MRVVGRVYKTVQMFYATTFEVLHTFMLEQKAYSIIVPKTNLN